MGVVWLVVAALCVVAGVVLLTWDRRRRAGPPDRQQPGSPGPDDLFTPDALPRHPDNG